MSDITLDCKGLPCPQPILKCRDCLDAQNPSGVTVIVDNDAAKENVKRFLTAQGYAVEVEQQGDIWRLIAQKDVAAAVNEAQSGCDCEVMSPEQLASLQQKVVVFITSEHIGLGDDVLGGKLMVNFLGTLPELGQELWRIILVNGGVKLAATGHPALEKLQALNESGVGILVCGTCLEHFELSEKKAVGDTTNMLDVVSSLHLATKVIRP